MQDFLNFPKDKFSSELKRIGPRDIHEAFYEPMLYLALKG